MNFLYPCGSRERSSLLSPPQEFLSQSLFVSQWFPTQTLFPGNTIVFLTQWIYNTFPPTFLWPWITKTQCVPRGQSSEVPEWVARSSSVHMTATVVEGSIHLPICDCSELLASPQPMREQWEVSHALDPGDVKANNRESISPSPASFLCSLLGLTISLEALTRVNDAPSSTTSFPDFQCCPSSLRKKARMGL